MVWCQHSCFFSTGVNFTVFFLSIPYQYDSPPYLHLATSEMWCWSGGRRILTHDLVNWPSSFIAMTLLVGSSDVGWIIWPIKSSLEMASDVMWDVKPYYTIHISASVLHKKEMWKNILLLSLFFIVIYSWFYMVSLLVKTLQAHYSWSIATDILHGFVPHWFI